MIIVAAKVTAAPGKRDAFIEAAQPCIAATRREEGCRMYELYSSSEHPDKMMYYEHWENRAALDKHLASGHMSEFAKVKEEKGLQVGDIDIGIFEVA